MMTAMTRAGLVLVIVVTGIAWAASLALWPHSGLNRSVELDFTPPDPLTLEILALGDKPAAADLSWLKAVNYFGGRDGAEQWYASLGGLLNAVVELDPHFKYAYLFGGNALSSSLSGVDAADALLKRGRKQFPDDWQFPFYIGINAYIFRDDYKRAGRYIGEAAAFKEAPSFLGPFSTRLLASAGDCDESLRTVDMLLKNTSDKVVQKNLHERQRYLIWECNFQVLEQAVAHYTELRGAPPDNLRALLQGGMMPALPQDPYGGQWSLDPQGKVLSSTQKKRLKISVSTKLKEQIKQWR